MTAPTKLALIAGSTAVLALGGAAAALAAPASSTPTSSNAGNSHVSKAEAEGIAAQQVAAARVSESELENRHGQQIWDVELTRNQGRYEVVVDASSGAVLAVRPDDDHDHPSSGPGMRGSTDENGSDGDDKVTADAPQPNSATSSTPAVRLDRSAAARVALLKVPSARTTEIELEHEHGRTTWKVDLSKQGTEYELEIDADNGAVLSLATDRDDDTHASASGDHDGDHDD